MDTVRDADVVALYEMTIYGPAGGNGDLKVKFSRSELYSEPYITFDWHHTGAIIKYIKRGKEFRLSMGFGDYIDCFNQNANVDTLFANWKEIPNEAPLTQEQIDWLENIGIDQINEKFRNMEAVIDLSILR